MEESLKRILALAALFVTALPQGASALEALPETQPKFEKILYEASFDWNRAAGLKFELGTVNREIAGHSRIMATVSSKSGVQAVCERVLSTDGKAADPDSIPMSCVGRLFAPSQAPAAVTFLFANRLAKPVLRIATASGPAREAALK